ncbi:MAG: HAD-IA family hydrolase [Chloroflexi bacterium]|nr:HAD-IA family hydrolase [Chloroflexota bacterium]
MTIAAILFDLGDVIMREESEVKDAEFNTLHAELVEGIGALAQQLKARGYKLGLVADTRPKTAWNVLHEHNLYDCFDAFAISEQVGAEKPDPRMFLAALNALDIAPQDYGRVLMVGNNLARDIRGANQLGLISIWFHWNERYLPDPDREDKPTYEARNARELMQLIQVIEDGR